MSQPREGVAVLVACSAKKQAVPAAAKDLYVSPWHQKARAYAEATGHRWFILSALHCLLRPDKVIEPYEKRLPGDRQGKRLWAIVTRNALGYAFGRMPARVVLLGGEPYCEPLGQLLRDDGVVVERPLEGMGIGQQLAALGRMTADLLAAKRRASEPDLPFSEATTP